MRRVERNGLVPPGEWAQAAIVLSLCASLSGCGSSDELEPDTAADANTPSVDGQSDAALTPDDITEDVAATPDSEAEIDQVPDVVQDVEERPDISNDTDPEPDTVAEPDDVLGPDTTDDVTVDAPDVVDAEPEVVVPPPEITALGAVCVPDSGASELVIDGFGFTGATTVSVGGQTVDATVLSPNRVRIMVPDLSGQVGPVEVIVTVDGRSSVPHSVPLYVHRDVTWRGSDYAAYPSGFLSLAAVGDVDDDGAIDIAYSSLEGVHLLRHSSSTSGLDVATVDSSICGSPSGLAFGDINGDGVDDIVIGCETELKVLLGVAGSAPVAGTASPLEVSRTFHQDVVLADLDEDGDPDLCVRSQGSESLYLFRNDGSGRFTPLGGPLPIGADFSHVSVRDLTGDGHVDLITGNYSPGTVSVHPGRGDGTFEAPASNAIPAIQTVDFLDFNGDGLEDIAIASAFRDVGTSIYTASETGVLTLVHQMDDVAKVSVATTDVDRDGTVDVLGHSGSGLRVFLSGPWARGTCFIDNPFETPPFALLEGDYNGDTYPDFFSFNTNTRRLFFFFSQVRE